MRVLFLDFDGVLNHHGHFARLRPDRTAADVARDDESFDKDCVARVNAIVARTGCSAVASSSWRHMYLPEELEAILKRHGFEHRVLGVTPDLPRLSRGHEIQAWLDAHGDVTSFAILDDNNLGVANLTPHFVKTSFAFGLQDKHVEAVVEILQKGGRRIAT
jgi:hypothetical protein